MIRKDGIADYSVRRKVGVGHRLQYGGMEPSDAALLRTLKSENGRLKKLLAEQMLDNAMPRDVNSKKW